MTIQKNIQKVIDTLPDIMSDVMLTIANDAKALIQRRVQQKGLNASGNHTPKYSDSYAKRRQKKGRQINFMDLTDTGEMWRSIGVTNNRKEPNRTIVTVAGRDEFTQNKVDWNSTKQFEVLKLTKEEEAVLDEIFNELIGDMILTILNE